MNGHRQEHANIRMCTLAHINTLNSHTRAATRQLYICAYTHARTHTCIYKRARTHTCIYKLPRSGNESLIQSSHPIFILIHRCKHTHAHTHTHTHTHTRTHYREVRLNFLDRAAIRTLRLGRHDIYVYQCSRYARVSFPSLYKYVNKYVYIVNIYR